MDYKQYLAEHHHICESIIGLISIQQDIEGVQKVLSDWRPKLKEILKERCMTICEGMPEEEIKQTLEIMGLNK